MDEITSKAARQTQSISQLEKLLWGGHSSHAVAELKVTANSKRSPGPAGAALALTKWYASLGNYGRALKYFSRAKNDLKQDWECRDAILELSLLFELGNQSEAEKVLDEALRRFGENPEICLLGGNVFKENVAKGNLEGIDRLRLIWINKPFAAAGLSLLQSADPTRPLAFDNLTASPGQIDLAAATTKVSIIMPAFNAADTLPIALKSLLAQSWNNIEVLVVDDGSKDDTWSIIQSYTRDTRVRALRHSENQGAYAARNTGLCHASGELITVNDADDWCHPQRLAFQARHLLTTGAAFNTTLSARVHSDLTFRTKWISSRLLFESVGSLMMRRATIAELGGWDQTRFNADDELYHRLRAFSGSTKNLVLSGAPLTLQLIRPNALTADATTGVSSIKYGARREYKDAWSYWHALEMSKQKPNLTIERENRAFPVPAICKTQRSDRLRYDVLYVSSFAGMDERVGFIGQLLDAGHKLNLRQAWFHWPTLEETHISKELRDRFHRRVADCIVAGENVRCDVAIIFPAEIMTAVPDPLPTISTRGCILVVDEAPLTIPQKMWHELRFDLSQLISVTREVFGVEALIAPVSPVVRRSVSLAVNAPRLTRRDWFPLLELDKWKRDKERWSRKRNPVVGAHRGQIDESWQVLQTAFCAEENYQVQILGEPPTKISWKIPDTWSFRDLPVREFLSGLDILICYPHRDAFGMLDLVPIQAMAAEVPVVLPPGLRAIYKEAAVYANPTDVGDVVRQLWRSRKAYEEQALRGSRFVQQYCSSRSFAARVRPYLGSFAKLRMWRAQ